MLSVTIALSEIGMDMSAFESAKHLISWVGLMPTNNESAGKKKSVRISKAGQFLKPLMVQCALAAVKSKNQPYFAIKYGRLKATSKNLMQYECLCNCGRFKTEPQMI